MMSVRQRALASRAAKSAALHGMQLALRENLHRLLVRLARAHLVDTQRLFYETNGILQYQNPIVSGERYVIQNVLSKYSCNKSLRIIDVGANIGDYTQELLNYYPNADIIAFEPHPIAFLKIAERFAKKCDRVSTYNLALGSKNGEFTLYDYEANSDNSHSSFYPEVIEEIHRGKLTKNTVQVVALDDFCQQHAIERIDLLKIDTEGHELEVLRGARDLLTKGCIKLIQFEFNEMNVYSRAFLRDFYEMLNGYRLFRLAEDRLLSLGDYDTRYEIFKFQNI